MNLKEITLLGGSETLLLSKSFKINSAFNQNTIDFFSELSKLILTNSKTKDFPDLASFAFFCRKGNLNQKKRFYQNVDELVSRGLVFHVAPSNVPLNFAYSLISSLLAGSPSIIKISSEGFEQVDIFLDLFNSLLKKYVGIKNHISIIRYQNQKKINDYFSMICDVRILWGGDNTINQIRKSKIKPSATEIVFPDRHSLFLIDAESINEKNIKNLALNFFNDTFTFDQNACTSPKLIFWLGIDKTIKPKQKLFWNTLIEILNRKKYSLEDDTILSKYYKVITLFQKNKFKNTKLIDSRIYLLEIDNLKNEIIDYFSNSGLFIEYCSNDISDLFQLDSRKLQTLVYFGFEKEKINKLILKYMNLSFDRIVPCGRANEFDLNWDGYDLIKHLTRHIKIL